MFNGLGELAVPGVQRLQAVLPLNPRAFGAISPESALNTAISFVSNTHWQGYGGATTMGCLSQMRALTVQNFLPAATGIALVIALVRGFARHTAQAIGNVWVDLTRATLWVLLPLSVVFAVVFVMVFAVGLVGLGVTQNFKPCETATPLEALR